MKCGRSASRQVATAALLLVDHTAIRHPRHVYRMAVALPVMVGNRFNDSLSAVCGTAMSVHACAHNQCMPMCRRRDDLRDERCAVAGRGRAVLPSTNRGYRLIPPHHHHHHPRHVCARQVSIRIRSPAPATSSYTRYRQQCREWVYIFYGFLKTVWSQCYPTSTGGVLH